MPKAPLKTTGQLCTREGQPHLLASPGSRPRLLRKVPSPACPLGLSEASTDDAMKKPRPVCLASSRSSVWVLGTVKLRGDALAPGHTTKDRQS